MKKNFKNSEMFRFIELYKSHEVLWNVNNSLYRRNDLKLKAYQLISKEMNMTVEAVKKKIKSLRTSYSAEKRKVEKSQRSATDPIYIPTLFWYKKMNFLNGSLMRRAPVDDNSYQEDVESMVTTFECEVDEFPYSETPIAEARISTSTCSKKRNRSPEPTYKLDEALEKPISLNKDTSVFEIFGQSIGRQIDDFPSKDAYQAMADIQAMLSKRKIEILSRNRHDRLNVELHSSSSSLSCDVLRSAMSEADILERDDC